jgi:hypothetical protein
MIEGAFSLIVREREYDAHNGYCRIKGCVKKIHSFHHRLPNTKSNRKLYPKFIDSQFNCAGLCDHHHTFHASEAGDITVKEAVIYEQYLEEITKSSDENKKTL